ncbi:MAG: pyridoxamine 5'-phosphate oxidase family protein [Burkholderiales bacterium]|nr:pyridoxamine 5'-phosphate oxidase family protein [Burkholderiales bacterium]MDE1928436.1 pyridoxamine 5'-phosphate oxidase family protein [Burkholderiales bacterium]MDE2160790.1 pyridoxamine 5'-phosphate oxidase family protein [Burkholderiales bacterium]
MPAQRLEDLAAIEAALWQELGRATRDKAHGWRIGVLASAGDDGADARSVVLREFDAATRELSIYTDARSPKVQQLGADPRATLVLWSAALGWQLRLKLSVRVETCGLTVSSRWALLKMTPAAHDYLSPLPPGTALPSALQPPERGTRDHFAILIARVEAVDWLELHAQGQRRACFGAGPGGWLAP